MENNFVEVAKKTIDELHTMNIDTVKDLDCPYNELFPLYASREVVIDGETYCMSIDIVVRKTRK